MSDPHTEDPFHTHIVERLVAHNWMLGDSKGYDPKTGLYTQDALDWLRKAHKDEVDAYLKLGQNTEESLLQQLVHTLEKTGKDGGMLHVLRHGFHAGAEMAMSVPVPSTKMRVSTAAMKYADMRFRVVKELYYSAHHQNHIDIGLFINGLPVVTIEVKSHFTQEVESAVTQYKKDRLPGIRRGKNYEPLLTFRRGALVHFAVAQDDVRMCTKLQGSKSYFLPFNRGKNGGAGNDPYPGSSYPAAHLWEDVLRPEHLVHIIRNLMLVENLGEDLSDQRMIFPRYHQYDVVRKLLDATADEGVGKRYLIQHSAGSGKSKSIVWTAYGLYNLQKMVDGARRNVFDGIILVTDRTVLDAQLGDELGQLDIPRSVYQHIGKGSESKSERLKKALHSTRQQILVVTIHTFPELRKLLDREARLRDKKFAVIIDEAHSSTTGKAAMNLREALTGVTEDEFASMTPQDQLRALQSGRGMPQNVSFYAFTATPKETTLILFGRDEDNRPDTDGRQPYHNYTMKQAIEEGFILDVLDGYVSRETAYKISLANETQDKLVEGAAAKRQVGRWLAEHDEAIEPKVDIILDHFERHVAKPGLLKGNAKAMIVAASRAAAAKFYFVLQKKIGETARYADLQAVVAFSDKLKNRSAEGVIHPDLPDDHEFTEANINKFHVGGRSPAALLDENRNIRFLIVNNKYLTGFDQPKLVAMYVDKPMGGIDAVQGFSRLNRTYPGKEGTFILDFVNKAEDISAAFEPFYQKTYLTEAQDPNVVQQLQAEIYGYEIFDRHDVRQFMDGFENGAPTSKSLAQLNAPQDRYNDALAECLKQLKELADDIQSARAQGLQGTAEKAEAEYKMVEEKRNRLEKLKATIQRFHKVYGVISQVIPFQDADLEAFDIYVRLLAKRLNTPKSEAIDVSALNLAYYIVKRKPAAELTGVKSDGAHEGVAPLSGKAGSGKAKEKSKLSEILAQISKLMDISVEEATQRVVHVAEAASKDKRLAAQMQVNSNESVRGGTVLGRLIETILTKDLDKAGKFTDRYFDDVEIRDLVNLAVLEHIRTHGRSDPSTT